MAGEEGCRFDFTSRWVIACSRSRAVFSEICGVELSALGKTGLRADKGNKIIREAESQRVSSCKNRYGRTGVSTVSHVLFCHIQPRCHNGDAHPWSSGPFPLFRSSSFLPCKAASSHIHTIKITRLKRIANAL